MKLSIYCKVAKRIGIQLCLVATLWIGIVHTTNAQTNHPNRLKVSGIVVDKLGLPMPGVNVVVLKDGKPSGMMTTPKGEFDLSVDKGALLRFSFIGMKTVKKVITHSDLHMKIVMEDSSVALDQVVVLGYTTTTKRRTTGSVATIDDKELKRSTAPNLEMRLQGKVAGVDIKALSGRPGEVAKIRMRGLNTISGNAEPLWVIDGVPLERDVPKIHDRGDLARIFANGVSGINPNDIENITILKDASATAIYGSRAAGGVIVITTKSGKAGKMKINYSTSLTVAAAPPRSPHLMNAKEKISWEKELWNEFSKDRYNRGVRYPVLGIYGMAKSHKGLFKDMTDEESEKYINQLGQHTTNWFDVLFRTALSQNHFLSLSGGNTKQTYYLSFGYDNTKGIEKGSDYQRYSFNGKYALHLNDKIQLSVISDLSLQKTQGTASLENPYYYAYFANPYEKPYDENGDYAPDRTYKAFSELNGGIKGTIPPNGFNILREMRENRVDASNIAGSLKANLSVDIIDGLRFEGLASYAYSASYNDAVYGKNTYTSFLDRPFESSIASRRQYGSLVQSNSHNQIYNLRGQFTYRHTFGNHFVSALFGSEIREQHNRGVYQRRYDYDPKTGLATIPRPLIGSKIDASLLEKYLNIMDQSIGQTDIRNALASFYFSADYSYLQKYIVSITARTDGSSSFGTKEQFNPTGSLGLSWNIDREDFLKDLKPTINSLTLRVAGGFTGNINKSIYPQLILDYNMFKRRITAEGSYPISTIKSPPNPNLRWEKTRDLKASLEIGLFDDRIHLLAEGYHRLTSDVVTFSSILSTTGFTEQSFNTSKIMNDGLELSLSSSLIKRDDWLLSISGNIGYNVNRLIEFNAPSAGLSNGVYVGYPLNALMSGKLMGIDPITGVYMYRRRSDAQMKTTADRQNMENYLFYIGPRNAPINGGTSINLTYKNLSLYIGGSYSIGGKVLDNLTAPEGSRSLSGQKTERVPSPKNDLYQNYFNVDKSVTRRWTPEHPITNANPRLIDAYGENLHLTGYLPQGSMINNAALIQDVSYYKLGTIMLSYSLGSQAKWLKQLGINSLGINVSVNNVAILTNYTGIDPETPGAVYPIARSYTFGLNLDF